MHKLRKSTVFDLFRKMSQMQNVIQRDCHGKLRNGHGKVIWEKHLQSLWELIIESGSHTREVGGERLPTAPSTENPARSIL